MYVTVEGINLVGAVITIVTVIFSIIFHGYHWYFNQKKKDDDIKKIKEELHMCTHVQQAVLDGLKQMGCTEIVAKVSEILFEYINKQSHDM